MGDAGSTVAVADAGPLIHLGEIGALPLLHVFGELRLPDAVWAETVGAGRLDPAALEKTLVVRRDRPDAGVVARFVQEHGLVALHTGECECLYLCHQIGIPTLLTDDLAVRDAAKQLHITPVGSLGVVLRAHLLGQISNDDAERYLMRLYDVSSLFVTPAIVELALDQLRARQKAR